MGKKKKIDIEAKMFMFLLHLKEEKNKRYSEYECEKRIVYLFDNYDEFKAYFELNGFPNISKNILESCRMKTTKKGTIIALKGLCDYAIRRHKSICQNTNVVSEEKQRFEVFAVHHDKAFVVSLDKTEEFLRTKPNSETRLQQEKMADKLDINNLSSEEQVLKRTIK